MLLLIHKENCPYCVKVRQFMSDHHLSYTSLVSPSGSPSRELLQEIGGQQQVPFLIDFDKGKMMYESSDIIDYLESNYL